ncbi:dnaJ homolog subfamily C member 15-like isoform X1 [Chiloscyllium plagiosum]|uniref:dnaJ homolog subfamily C member 15-like isoform X1 n=1 Tax=Chiloscyllium plagiosum TaxID=36176 RepID=UPI001CB7CC9B|nr:dnaJ homolog subfamily C member 15-like isoform X1 [Chiloscyllium plagiosum]
MSGARQSERGDGGDSGRTLIAVGLGVAAAAFAGRHAFRLWKPLQQIIVETARRIPSPSFPAYYKGGFEAKMNKREATLILGVSSSASRTKVGEAHKRIMLLNHPDRGFYIKFDSMTPNDKSYSLVQLYDYAPLSLG